MIASIKWRWYNENIIYMEERVIGGVGYGQNNSLSALQINYK